MQNATCDAGEGRRRWRALDPGTVQAVLEAGAPRLRCLTHGPTVAAVPWARHAAGHTYAFDEQVAWLATQCSKNAITELMRIALAHGAPMPRATEAPRARAYSVPSTTVRVGSSGE